MQTNHLLAWGALSATATFYSATCILHVSFNDHTASMGCRGCHQQTSVPVYNQPCWCQLDRNCDHQILTSIRVKCWWYRAFFRQHTIMDADHRGGWTQFFGSKASEPETSRPVVKCNFYLQLPPAFHAPVGAIPSEFRRYFMHHTNTESLGYCAALSAWSYV